MSERGKLDSVAFASTDEQTITTITAAGRRHTIYVYCDQATTVKLYWANQGGTAREIYSQAVSASTGTVLDFDYAFSEISLRHTPGAEPGTFEYEVIPYAEG